MITNFLHKSKSIDKPDINKKEYEILYNLVRDHWILFQPHVRLKKKKYYKTLDNLKLKLEEIIV